MREREIQILVSCHKCGKETTPKQMQQEHWYRPVHVRVSDGWLQTQLCPKCAPVLSLRRWVRRYQIRIGRFSRVIGAPGFGSCSKCHTSWEYTIGHTTDYREGQGCFPLCEKCWTELLPHDRLPFYRQLWQKRQHGNPDDEWAEIEQAVLAGY